MNIKVTAFTVSEKSINTKYYQGCGRASGSVVFYLSRDQEVAVYSLIGVTALCPRARHISLSLILVQPKKTPLDITEKLLTGTKSIESSKSSWLFSYSQKTNQVNVAGNVILTYLRRTHDTRRKRNQLFLPQWDNCKNSK